MVCCCKPSSKVYFGVSVLFSNGSFYISGSSSKQPSFSPNENFLKVILQPYLALPTRNFPKKFRIICKKPYHLLYCYYTDTTNRLLIGVSTMLSRTWSSSPYMQRSGIQSLTRIPCRLMVIQQWGDCKMSIKSWFELIHSSRPDHIRRELDPGTT